MKSNPLHILYFHIDVSRDISYFSCTRCVAFVGRVTRPSCFPPGNRPPLKVTNDTRQHTLIFRWELYMVL